MISVIGKIFRTDDYDKFKMLYGNRDVSESKKIKLLRSIKENGYILNPIEVNKDFEIIDGQGRYLALKELNVPVDYFVNENAGIKECMILNINVKNWTIADFIKSYAEQGNINYIRLRNYEKLCSMTKLYLFVNSLYGGSDYNYEKIRNGKVEVSEETFEKSIETLQFLKELELSFKNIEGRTIEFRKAVAFAFSCAGVDKFRLKENLIKYSGYANPIANLESALKELSKIYNRRKRQDFRYFDSEWDVKKREKKALSDKRYRKRETK